MADSDIDWDARAADVLANFAATGTWFATGTPSLPEPVDWNAVAAEVTANFQVTGQWFLGTLPAPTPTPPPGSSDLAGTPEADTLEGTTASETIRGLAGDDIIRGEPVLLLTPDAPPPNTPGAAPVGDNRIFGDEGDDSITAGLGSDTVQGGPGNDRINGAGDLLGQGFPFVAGPIFQALTLDGADLLQGGDGDDGLSGQGGDDSLFGDAGEDSLAGGTGVDRLTGGPGRDVFIFAPQGPNLGVFDTGTGPGNRDILVDFQPGEDVIDLSAYTQRSTSPATFLGTAAFLPEPRPQLRYAVEGDHTVVQFSRGSFTGADGTVQVETDLEIELVGVVQPSAADFAL